MLDDDKPRRSQADELAEIEDLEARKHTAANARLAWVPPGPSLAEIVAEMEAKEEAAYQDREHAETPFEREESARIQAVEAETEAEIPALRARELHRTFSRVKPAYAADAYPVDSGCVPEGRDLAVGRRIVDRAEAEKGLECGHRSASSVVAKDELVKVDRQMLL